MYGKRTLYYRMKFIMDATRKMSSEGKSDRKAGRKPCQQ